MLIKHNLLSAKKWVAPDRIGVYAVLDSTTWDVKEYAIRTKVSVRSVFSWMSGETKINYAAWCVLCAHAGLGHIWLNDTLEQAELSLSKLKKRGL